jgi:hypothetical protein
MNLLALKGEVSCKCYIAYKVRSQGNYLTVGSVTTLLWVLPFLTALKGGVSDPTANEPRRKPGVGPPRIKKPAPGRRPALWCFLN